MNNSDSAAESKEVKSTSNNANPVTEQERELAREAQVEFNKGDFIACSNLLNKLEALRPRDLKVTHNNVIVDYYKSKDLKKTEILRKSLNAICVGPPLTKSTTTTASTSTVTSNATTTTAATVTTSTTPTTTITGTVQSAETDEIERSVLRYNQAIILYHSRQYQAALEIVNSLFTLIEPMEESFVHKVCLLLIELHIVLGRPDIALTLVNYIETQFTSTADSSKSTLSDQSQNQKHEAILKSNIKVTAINIEKEQKKDSIDVATDIFRIKLLKYKLRIYLRTLQLKLCKKEWKTLVSLGMPTNLSTIFLKANLEYLRKNFKKAMKLLNTINNETCPEFKTCGESIAVLYYNNIASLHFAMGKPNLACFYLKAALEENKKAIDSIKVTENKNSSSEFSPPPIHTYGRNKHYELIYSLGVSFLYTGQATKAFDCFVEAFQQLYNSPRLWLRMAECCILCHKSTNKIDFDISGRRKDIVERVVGENNGSGISRKFILGTSLSKNCKYHPEGLSYTTPQPTLEYASLCLKNALFLLPTTNCEEMNLPVANLVAEEGAKKTILGHQQQSSLLGSLTPTSSHKLGNNTNSSLHINSGQTSTQAVPSQSTTIENLNLKISILTAGAYISLCLGDYILALHYSKSLLCIKKLPGAHWLLGNLYAAESLIFLDRIYEALEHLKPESLQDISTYIPIGETVGDKEKVLEEVIEQRPSKVSWYPVNVATAKSILRYNLAVAYAIRGELDKSGEILKQVWTSKGPDCNVPIHVIMLALYIELQLGHVEIARSLIKQHYCPVQQQ